MSNSEEEKGYSPASFEPTPKSDYTGEEEREFGDLDEWESPLFQERDEYIEYLAYMEDLQARAASSHRRHFVPKVGLFETIYEDSWDDYKKAVLDGKLHFNPSGHPWFDKIVAEASGLPALLDPDNPKYAKYEDLRNNIAVLRNYLLNHFFPDGEFNEGEDEKEAHYVGEIAIYLGTALKNGATVFSNPLRASINFKKACTDFDGAREMYRALIARQNIERRFNPLLQTVYFIKGERDNKWKLPSIEETPFFQKDMCFNEPPPELPNSAMASYLAAKEDAVLRGSKEVSDTSPYIAEASGVEAVDEAATLVATAVSISNAGTVMIMSPFASGKRSVESLDKTVKYEAIKEARNILENLRIGFGDTEIDALLKVAPNELQKLVSDSSDVVSTFQEHLEVAKEVLGDEFGSEQKIIDAEEAAAKLGAQAKLAAMQQAEIAGDMELAASIDAELQKMPKEWRTPEEHTVKELLDKIEEGLEYTVKRLEALRDVSKAEQNQHLIDPMASSMSVSAAEKKRDDDRIHLGMEEQYQQRQQEKHKQRIASVHHHASKSLSSSKFDNLIGDSDLVKMRKSMSADTSGDFDVASPNNTQKIISQHVSSKRAAASKQQQRQQKEQQLRTQRKISSRRQQQINADRIEDMQQDASSRESRKSTTTRSSSLPRGGNRGGGGMGM